MPAEPWASRCTDSPDVIVLEVRYHHRAGSRKSELPLAVTHAKTKQLTTVQEQKGYKIKTPYISKTV